MKSILQTVDKRHLKSHRKRHQSCSEVTLKKNNKTQTNKNSKYNLRLMRSIIIIMDKMRHTELEQFLLYSK